MDVVNEADGEVVDYPFTDEGLFVTLRVADSDRGGVNGDDVGSAVEFHGWFS
jgi:hypothetical protein